MPADVMAHGVTAGDKGYIQEVSGILLIPFAYLGAKHMVTGYDHLLFLLGIIFFLYRLKDIGLYVSLFAIGHSTTMIPGVLTGISVSSFLIDAIIGLSVVYKAMDNIGAFRRWFGRVVARSPDAGPGFAARALGSYRRGWGDDRDSFGRAIGGAHATRGAGTRVRRPLCTDSPVLAGDGTRLRGGWQKAWGRPGRLPWRESHVQFSLSSRGACGAPVAPTRYGPPYDDPSNAGVELDKEEAFYAIAPATAA
jgi:hypothetical protein